MTDSLVLDNKVAVVTGVAHPQGIGRAIYNAFSAAGANVVGTDLASALERHQMPGFACDVTSSEDLQHLAKWVNDQYGGLDILVNNAGVGVGEAEFMSISEQDWNTSIAVNLMGVVSCTKALLPLVRSPGSMINVASVAGLGALAGIPACYTATKFAVVGLTKSLAKEFAPRQIRVNALCPGSVKTQMHETAMELLAASAGVSLEDAEVMENAQIPMGRSASAQEIGSVALFLASEASRYVTGVALPVAGGMAQGL